MARHGWWIGRDVLSLGSLNLIRWATKWTSCWTQKSPQDFSTDSFHAPLSSSDLILLTFPRDPLLTWNELGYAMHENNRACSFHRWTVSRFYWNDGFSYFDRRKFFEQNFSSISLIVSKNFHLSKDSVKWFQYLISYET